MNAGDWVRKFFLGMLAVWMVGCPSDPVMEVEEFFFPRDMYPFEFEAEPQLEAPDRLLFLELVAGDVRTRRAMIGNGGRRGLELEALELEGAFEMVLPDHPEGAPAVLLPGETMAVDVTYEAVDQEPRVGTLTVVSNDPERPEHVIDLLANVELPCVDVVPSTQLRFGAVLLGESAQRSVRVINCSERLQAEVEVRDFEGDEGFGLQEPELLTAPLRLEAGEMKEVWVDFVPAESRGYVGALTFESDDLENPVVTVSLRGAGTTEPCGMGSISGRACTPDQETLAAANVVVSGVDCEGTPFTTGATADSEGFFEIDGVPAGTQEVRVSLGSFSGTQAVEVRADRNTDLGSDGVCIDGSAVSIAVLDGAFDDVGGLLEGLEIDYEYVGDDFGFGGGDAQEFLTDLDAMMAYQILFIECGSLWNNLGGGLFGGVSVHDVVISNLRNYVQSGRSLYVSDQSYEFVREAFPEAANFRSPYAKEGNSQTVSAEVASTAMYNLLNRAYATLNFNLGGWVVMETPPPGVEVHFRGDAEVTGDVVNAPFLVSYTHPPSGGRVIYTSFHNDAQGGLGGDMERILRYLIFQL